MPKYVLLENAVLLADSTLSRGVSIALSGLTIVFVALLLITAFIASLPHLLKLVARVWPEVKEPQSEPGHPQSLVPDDNTVLAAIGFVLHTEFQRQLATEDMSKKR